jgi:hypothetical protein
MNIADFVAASLISLDKGIKDGIIEFDLAIRPVEASGLKYIEVVNNNFPIEAVSRVRFSVMLDAKDASPDHPEGEQR